MEGPEDGVAIGRVADALKVSVRTLRHWDEVGVARPAGRSTTGFRLYTATDIARLRRVLAYRELGFSLGSIAGLLEEPAEQTIRRLRERREETRDEIHRLQRTGRDLDRLAEALVRGPLLSLEQQAELFGPGWDPDWTEQARERWGDTPAWAEHAERSAHRSPEQWADLARAVAAAETELARVFIAGVRAEDPEAGALADRHRAALSMSYAVTPQRHVLLGRMYLSDPEFTAHYERRAEGLTAWLVQVIEARARSLGIDPETAAWA